MIPGKIHVRQRACKPKTRTGCRTCKARRIKCDEGRPICRRCMTSGRACAYIDPSAASTNPAQYALILPKPVRALQGILSRGSSSIERLDIMHLDFFRLHTIKELPGSELDFPWQNVLLPAGSCEPVILDAISALGCIHRAQSKALPGSPSAVESWTESYELYQKAVVSLRRYIDRAPELGLVVASDTALVAIMLLFCFEVLCGNDHYATKHLTAAFSILAKTQGHQGKGPKEPTTLVLRTSNAPQKDVVVQFFLRLASDWVVAGPLYCGGSETPLQAVCKDPMPSHFQSVRDASIHLDALCSEVSKHWESQYEKAEHSRNLQPAERNMNSHECVEDCLVMAMSHVIDSDDQGTFRLAVDKTIATLTHWRAAFAYLLRSNSRSKSVLLLEIQYLQTWLTICTLNDSDEMLYDTLEDDFRRTIDVAEDFLLQTSALVSDTGNADHRLQGLSNVGNNLTSTICMVIEKCRDSKIRRRGIKLLGALDLRGIFDTPYIVAYYRHLVTEEEMRARALHDTKLVDLKCSDVPREARFIEAIFCYCDSQREGEEFYKQSYGAMVYVVMTDRPGVYETGQSSFSICRDSPRMAVA